MEIASTRCILCNHIKLFMNSLNSTSIKVCRHVFLGYLFLTKLTPVNVRLIASCVHASQCIVVIMTISRDGNFALHTEHNPCLCTSYLNKICLKQVYLNTAQIPLIQNTQLSMSRLFLDYSVTFTSYRVCPFTYLDCNVCINVQERLQEMNGKMLCRG